MLHKELIRYLILFLGLLSLTMLEDSLWDNQHYGAADNRRLQNEMDRKFKQADRLYERLKQNRWQLNMGIPEETGIIFIAYRNDSLIYWSDNRITLAPFRKHNFDGKRFEFISNGWYVIKPYTSNAMVAYALILIKSQYPYENAFLQNKFQADLKLPQSTELLTMAQPGSFAIHDWEGIYLFSIRFSSQELRFESVERYLTPALYFITLLFFLMFLRSLLLQITGKRSKNLAWTGLALLLFLFRLCQYFYHFPSDIYTLEIFGPMPFAQSAFLPSLGDVFLNTVLILFLATQFNRDFTFPARFSEQGRTRLLILIVMILGLIGVFLYTYRIFSDLILHSTINFELYKVASLNLYSLVGLTIAVMQFSILLILIRKMLSICGPECRFDRLILVFILVNSLTFLILYLIHYHIDFLSIVFFLLLFITLALMHYRHIRVDTYTPLAFMAILFSVYAVYFISFYTHKRTMENMRVMAENLAAQHDPVAEYLFEDLSQKLEKDSVLMQYLFGFSRATNYDQLNKLIFEHLQSNYFNGFWGKYKLLFQVCTPITMIWLNDEGPIQQKVNCYDFYDNMIGGGSMKLPRSDFYYLDVQNGRINYLGWFHYVNSQVKKDVNLYVELQSRLVNEELGYPELLLDKRYQKNKLLEEYSYAKYYKNQLITRSGSFQYSLNLDTYHNKSPQFDGYNHLIYYVNKDSVVMVSVPTPRFFDKLVSFSYIFLFLYLILLLYTFIGNFSKLGRSMEFNFKNKIQLSIIAVLFLSLLLVGGGTIYFSIQQYQHKQHDLLAEKIQSVYLELDQQLAYQKVLGPYSRGDGYDNLNQLLINLSDVFYTDINLYDPSGNLLATSRQDIFTQGMQGEKMNPMAYDKMVKEKQAEYIHQERIGGMNYLSAYVPFVNAENRLMAFLNLPYFTKQDILRNDITTLVVAILNIYVLLILVTIAMGVIISDQITRPLRLIQQRFSEIKLGKKNEQIIYYGKDEIAGLVAEYNRMVQELAKSMEMLARSERETAWREMAKQVAHEIKNPLTPMKLSVQHLLRSWNDQREDFNEFLEKVSHTLIEQIDNLSFIASEFSNFAKMPKAINERLNLIESIQSTLALFDNTENVHILFEHESPQIMVFADREQLSRVFINLLKNAIQSIPEDRAGRIVISVVRSGSFVRVNVVDNGKGIPEDLQDRLFTPSFTTKSSGMGLGLSIVKNIIESFGGQISFRTKVNQGTTFFIELPVN